MITSPASQIHSGGYRAPAGPVERSGRAAEALIPAELVPVGRFQGEPSATQQPNEAGDVVNRLEESVRKANAYLAQADTQLEFLVGEKTGRIIVKVLNKETHEVIRTIPPEEMIRFSEQVSRMRGLLFDAEG